MINNITAFNKSVEQGRDDGKSLRSKEDKLEGIKKIIFLETHH